MDDIQIDDFMNVVINPNTPTLEELELIWNKYQSLPIQLMQHSDDIAIKLYGNTNRTIYEKRKAELLINRDDYNYTIGSGVSTITSEGFSIDNDSVNANDNKELLANIEKAKSLNTDTMVVIYPLTVEYPYTLDELQAAFTRYNMLSQDLKTLSDQECMNLFGVNNLNMYAREKAKLLDLIDQAPESFDPDFIQESDQSKNWYFEIATNTKGLVNLYERKIEMYIYKMNGTILESTIAEDSLSRIDSSLNKERELSDCVPEFVPFFTPTEIEDIIGDELTEDDKEFIHNFKSSIANGLKDFDSKAYFDKLNSISENKDQTYIINMIKMGWNPNIPISESGFCFSRERMIKYINEYYAIDCIDIVPSDASYIKENMIHDIDFQFKPVFLLTSGNECYISIDPELSLLYKDKEENKQTALKLWNDIKNDDLINIYVAFVDSSTHGELIKHINDGRYNMELFNAMRNNIQDVKHLCATFVNAITTLANIDRANEAKVYHIYSGKKINYTADLIIPTLKAILSDTAGFVLRKFTPKEALRKEISDSDRSYEQIAYNESVNAIKMILAEICALYTPTSVVLEAKSLPIRISGKGIVFDLPTRIEEEYQAIHKTLIACEDQQSYEAMKEPLAHLWYLNLLCERKINKYKDKENKEQKLKVSRDTRARILNDFKKYLKMVVSNDKEFDFTSYFTKSKYNDRSLFVNTDTLKYTGKVVASVVKSLINKKQ